MTHQGVARGRMTAAIVVAVALIFATPFIGQLRTALLRAFPDRFALYAGMAIAIAVLATVAAALWTIRERRLLRFGTITAGIALAVAYAYVSRTDNPLVNAVERFHFIEYGVVTLLFWRAWSPVGDASQFVLPVLAGLLVATAEEWLQWFIPARVGEVRDIFLNLWAILCGVLLSVGLDPPARFRFDLSPESWTRIRRLAAVLVLALGAFMDSVHLGHRIDFDGGSFRSRYRADELMALSAERTSQWRMAPPMSWGRLSREDQYMTEGVQHVQRRNEAWQANDVSTAWHENLILERYFAPVLDTPSYVSATGHRWIPGHRAEAERRYVAPVARFESRADDPPIFLWSRAAFWTVVMTLALLLMYDAVFRRTSMFKKVVMFTSVLSAIGLAMVPGMQLVAQSAQEAELVKRARGIHDRVIAMDTHVDINADTFLKYTERLTTQVNLPKMIEGGLDAPFFIVYVGQGPLTDEGYANAYKQAVAKFDAIHKFTKEIAPDKIELALRAADVPRIIAKGKKVALIGIENAYPIGTDLGKIKEFYDRGGRYMSLAHNGHSQFSDSNTGERDGQWAHNGLSELGRKAIAEMNRLGIMVDVSHPSKLSMMQTVELSKAPVIASHSSVRKLADHSRNMDDEMLLAMKRNGGVVQMVALAGYVKVQKPDSPERAAAIAALRKEFGLPEPGARGGGGGAGGGGGRAGGGGGGRGGLNALGPEKRAEYDKRMAEIDKRLPGDPRATVKDFVNHIDYAVKLIGIDHVGISSDFDGGGGIDGWNDASETFNVTLELVRRGYTEQQIAKIWSGNLLRVMAAVEKVAGR